MTRHLTRLVSSSALAGSALFLGCAAPAGTGAAFEVTADRYPAALETARQVILDQGLALERIDASAGVVTSAPSQSAGLFTPWDRTASSFADEVEDASRPHFRSVRISFVPVERASEPPIGTPGTSFTPAPDVRADPGPLKVVVQAFLYARHKPDFRLETESIRRSRAFTDPALVERVMQPTYLEPVREDPEFARRLSADLQRRLTLK
ncbi:MAG: hypothetical protein IT439_11035 [Phycisphaerales bacterium]|nr:hypothetical protein [Phycisphaerales bacterium]